MNKEIIKEINKICKEHDGWCNQEQVLDYAKNPDSALHKRFCWDDTEAAHRYRLVQAGEIIRKYKVVIRIPEKKENIKVRVLVSMLDHRGKEGFCLLNKVLSHKDSTKDYIRQIKKQIASFKNKLATVSMVAYHKAQELDDILDKEIQKLDDDCPQDDAHC